jgi:copper chaperone CopZ
MFAKSIALLSFLLLAGSVLHADEPSGPQRYTVRMWGLFCEEREADLRELIATIPNAKVVSASYQKSEATFEFDPKLAFPNSNPKDAVNALKQTLDQATRASLTVNASPALPPDSLRSIEIRVGGLDCMACSYAAYSVVANTTGVDRATSNLKRGIVTAMIDPSKTSQEALEKTLRERGLIIKNADGSAKQ